MYILLLLVVKHNIPIYVNGINRTYVPSYSYTEDMYPRILGSKIILSNPTTLLLLINPTGNRGRRKNSCVR